MIEIDCPECAGDGISRCTNPDHGFIDALGGEIARLGCPVCGHDPDYKVHGEKCEYCKDGKIKVYTEAELQEEREEIIVMIDEYIDDDCYPLTALFLNIRGRE